MKKSPLDRYGEIVNEALSNGIGKGYFTVILLVLSPLHTM